MANRINLGRVIGATGERGERGLQGERGSDGLTPYIQNGYWWIGQTSTNIRAKGNDWLYGTEIPTVEGVDGDLYLNTETNNVYKKENGVWEFVTNIKGSQGERGERGETALTFTVGEVTTGLPEQPATVVNSGTGEDIVLDFVIPKGATGAKGDKGDAGTNSIIVGGEVVDSVEFTSDPQTQLNSKEPSITPITNAEIDSLFQGGTD